MADDNRPLKYLRYAIGEIVLVVIGILIALSINNWNEKRKIENMGKEYIREIYVDLTNEISNLDEIITTLQTQYNGTENILSVFESSEKIITDSIQFNSKYRGAVQMFIVQRDLNTFDKLKSSGQIGLIKNDSLSNLLDSFYETFDERISNFSEFPLQIRMDLKRITFEMGSLEGFNFFLKNQKSNPAYTNEYFNNEEVYHTLLSILKTSYFNINYFNESLTEATNLMHYMEENYPELKHQK